MTEYRIPCEMLFRLSHVIGAEAPLNTIRYEAGMLIATNRQIMAIQATKETDYPPPIHITISPELIAECDREADNDGDYVITPLPGMPWASGTISTNGWLFAGNAVTAHPPRTVWDSWTTVIPDAMPTKPSGSLIMDVELLAKLGRSSPSGQFVFPEFINNSQPTIVRDKIDRDWFGLFISTDGDNGRFNIPPAQYPEWFTLT